LPFGEELDAGIAGRTTQIGYTQPDSTRQRFTSKERDSESKLDYFGARYYASHHGRFTGAGPMMGVVRRDLLSWTVTFSLGASFPDAAGRAG
jgi:RHS repeat-associated protein